jgi:hypothetical protein
MVTGVPVVVVVSAPHADAATTKSVAMKALERTKVISKPL